MFKIILAAIVVVCLFYGRIPTGLLVLIVVGTGGVLALPAKHKHTRFLALDVLAQSSRLNAVNADLKFWCVIALSVLGIAANSAFIGLFLAVAALLLAVPVGGLDLTEYMGLLTLPAMFLLVSGLALLIDVSGQPVGILNIRLFGYWLCVSAESQRITALVTARALGAVSCLYLLSLTTPMPEIIGVLRRARCPGVVISLMYLIYRYVFLLLSMYDAMRGAAASRMGFRNYRTSIRTTAGIYSNLLACSYRAASSHFDAMESRCFDSDIRFLEQKRSLQPAHVALAVGLVATTCTLAAILHRGGWG